MATIKAFKGLRFDSSKAGAITELVCPPYDIISESQRLSYIERNKNNIIRLELPRGDDCYEQAGGLLREWLSADILKKDGTDSLYIYEEEFKTGDVIKKVKGLTTLVKLSPFSEGDVLPHEFTLSKAKTDRFNLMKTTHCNFSQIYSLYDGGTDMGALIDSLSAGKPEIEFADADDVTHRLWTVTDTDAIASLEQSFVPLKLYIADGHHRYETALNFRDYIREQGISSGGYDYVMMTLVDMNHPGLLVLPTHRLIRGMDNFDGQVLLDKCADYFDIETFSAQDTLTEALTKKYDEGKKSFGFYYGTDTWLLITLKDISMVKPFTPGMSDYSRSLDVTVLHSLILENLLGIDKENMANQINLSYVKNVSDLIDEVDSERGQGAFILNPTRVSEIRDVASQGEKMPQKSTYFYPKLITGLVMNKLSD